MTANGWLQILLFLVLVFLVTKPMGIFMARVFNREKTFMDPVLRPRSSAFSIAPRESMKITRCAGPSTPSRCFCSAWSRWWCSI